MGMWDQVTKLIGGNANQAVDVQTKGSIHGMPVYVYNSSGNQLSNFGGGLIPDAYDYIALTYSGTNIATVTYKTGGVAGSTIATLTLGYDASNNLTSVAKT